MPIRRPTTLDSKAEWHLTKAVRLKTISPRPHNNLGRVLLRRSQQLEAKAREAEAKGKTDRRSGQSKAQGRGEDETRRRHRGVRKGRRVGSLAVGGPLEPRRGLLSLNDLDKAEVHFREIVKLRSESVKDRETINNFGQGLFWHGESRPGPQEA